MSVRRVEALKSKGKRKQELEKIVENINSFYSGYRLNISGLNPNDYSDRAKAKKYFSNQTNNFRREIETYISLGYSEDEALKRVLPKAYATVKLASDFLWKKPHYDVQLIGGILLNDGFASEMATGEGKTQTAALPTYLNALLGKGAHVITPNGYLAKRDKEEMGELYEMMGLSCGLVEERGKLSEEDISKKTLEILDTKIKKYTLKARNETERQELINKFFNDVKNREDIRQARVKAREFLRTEERLKRKAAYDADITYGSASAIAFDYLYDDIETDVNKMVQRKGFPNFAVVDEVDAVLFDDATTPFSLSGTQSDEDLAITEEERKIAEKKISLANYAILRIKTENESLIKRNQSIGQTDRLILEVKDENSFDVLTKEINEQTEEYDMTRALIINSATKEYKLTTLGETIIFQYYYAKDINRILLENKDKIVGMKFDGGTLYREGYDYTINNNGRILMEPRAFAHLVTSDSVPELTEIYNKFGRNEMFKEQPEIDNAIRAWFILEENLDYKLSVPNNPSTPNERVISLVMNGRTAEGRVYSNGLQQAIEAKEKYLKRQKFTIKETKIKNTLASIPTASFFNRYEKFAGMTGTAAVSAFKDLYGLETHEVPRNKPRQVVDHGDRMYASTLEKNEAIFQEVLKSYKKGQPVLLSTTSIEESQKLYAFLTDKFNKMGINISIPVLNANVDKLEEEAAIVSKAGLPKAITISTEMAGRGTDIKLGGEVPDINDLMKIIAEERIGMTLKLLKEKGNLTASNQEQVEIIVRKKVFEREAELEKEANKRRDIIKRKKNIMENEILKVGGLKVIGSGHFAYTRVDEQVKGRCGRQGNKGEIIFFNDREDLLKVGVPKQQADILQKQAEKQPIIENPESGSYPIGDIIYQAQLKTEAMVQASIKQSQEIESEVSFYRSNLREQKEELKRRGDYIDAVEYMLEETVKSILLASCWAENPSLRDSTVLTRSKIDPDVFISLTEEFIGIKLIESDLNKFRTVGSLKDYVTDRGMDSYNKRIKTFGREEINQESKEVVDKLLSRAWNDFEGYVENIKHQDMLNRMAQMTSADKIPAQITMAFGHCVESQRAMIVRELINPDYKTKIKGEPRNELVPVRVTPKGVQRVDREYDAREQEMIKEIQQETMEDKTTPSNIVNLQPRPRIFTLVNNAKLNKDSSTIGVIGASKNPYDDDLVSVDFNENHFNGKK